MSAASCCTGGVEVADARTSALLLVGSGDSDWELLFTQWNLMLHDTQIAHATRTLGWIGMLGSVSWFAFTLSREGYRAFQERGVGAGLF